MDILNKRRITEYLLDAKDKGCAVFVSSHELSELSGICDEIYYLSKNGELNKTDEDNNKSIHKLQVVVNNQLPDELMKKSVVVSNIGRVYTLIINADDDQLKEILDNPEIVQYDKLEVKVEDYFYIEEGGIRWKI